MWICSLILNMYNPDICYLFPTETMYRLCGECPTHQQIHAKKQKDHQVQNLEARRVDQVRVLCDDSDRLKHDSTHDEGTSLSATFYLLFIC